MVCNQVTTTHLDVDSWCVLENLYKEEGQPKIKTIDFLLKIPPQFEFYEFGFMTNPALYQPQTMFFLVPIT